MKLVKLEETHKFVNSDECKGIEYLLDDKDIDFSTATINGRYPNHGYCINEKCKELIYVIDGIGTLNKKNEEINFNKGDVILIEKGEMYYWEAKCTIAMICAPAWYPEQHKLIEE